MANPKPTFGPKKDQAVRPGLHNYFPRSYQLKVLADLDSGLKRAVCVWHRRAGKDKTFLNYTISQMMKRVGVYYHLFPTYGQGKRTIWDGIGSDGQAFLSHFPEPLIKAKNETEMQIQLKNGSIWQVIGTDRNLDNLVGPNPVGCVFSEYSIQDPRAWTLLRPILRENGGWAIFIYTPRGQNHGWDLFKVAEQNPNEWSCSFLTVDDTRRDSPIDRTESDKPWNVGHEYGGPVVTPADIEQEKREGMSDDMIAQEYYCSFQGSLTGAYYLKDINDADKAGRIKDVPWDPTIPVYTFWDLGYDDSTSIWFAQSHGYELGFIDYEEGSQQGLPYYAKILQEKPYTYGEHVFPHDIEVHDYGSGNTRKSIAESLGIDPITVAPKLSLGEGINAVRAWLPRAFFDKEKCGRGLDCLRNYRHEYDEEKKIFKDKPDHNWASHGADALRTGAVGFQYVGSQQPLKILTNLERGSSSQSHNRFDNVRVLSNVRD
jgi:hypothetical protein